MTIFGLPGNMRMGWGGQTFPSADPIGGGGAGRQARKRCFLTGPLFLPSGFWFKENGCSALQKMGSFLGLSWATCANLGVNENCLRCQEIWTHNERKFIWGAQKAGIVGLQTPPGTRRANRNSKGSLTPVGPRGGPKTVTMGMGLNSMPPPE